MALVCQRGVSQLRKFSQRWGGYGAAKSFRSQGAISQRGLGAAKLFRNQGPFSQGPFLVYEISQTMDFLGF